MAHWQRRVEKVLTSFQLSATKGKKRKEFMGGYMLLRSFRSPLVMKVSYDKLLIFVFFINLAQSCGSCYLLRWKPWISVFDLPWMHFSECHCIRPSDDWKNKAACWRQVLYWKWLQTRCQGMATIILYYIFTYTSRPFTLQNVSSFIYS